MHGTVNIKNNYARKVIFNRQLFMAVHLCRNTIV